MIRAFHNSRLGQVWSPRNLATIIILSLFTLSFIGQYAGFVSSPQTNESQIAPQDSSIDSGTPINKIYSALNNSLGEIAISHLYNLSAPNFNAPPEGAAGALNANLTYSYSPITNLQVLTIKNASLSNAISEPTGYASNITVRLNETVYWQYNKSTPSKEVGFQSKIQPAKLNRLFINSSATYIQVNTTDYWTSNTGMFYYNFSTLFDQNENGSFYLIYEYEINLPVSSWKVDALTPTDGGGYIYLNKTTSIVQKFVLNVTLGGFNGPHFDANFIITLPDPNVVTNFAFERYNNFVPANPNPISHQIKGNSLTVRTQLLNTTTIPIGLSFSAKYNISFLDTIQDEFLWFEDKLVDDFNKREREYKITVTDGPAHLALRYIRFNETLIYYDDTTSRVFNSEIDRSVGIENMNKSSYVQPKPGEPYEYVGHRAEGISVIGSTYYLYKDEVDVITVKYSTQRDLQIKIMDNIKNPLENYKANFYIFGQKYGTILSQFTSIPYPTKTSNEYGIILVSDIPRGNYTVEILDANGNFVQNMTASSEVIMNELVTEVVHFPTTILVYTGIFAAIFVMGMIIYRKNTQ